MTMLGKHSGGSSRVPKGHRPDYQIPVPACVKAAIDEYRSQNDWFGHFMEDKCETGDGFRESSSLYQAYRNYCIDTNEYGAARRTSILLWRAPDLSA